VVGQPETNVDRLDTTPFHEVLGISLPSAVRQSQRSLLSPVCPRYGVRSADTAYCVHTARFIVCGLKRRAGCSRCSDAYTPHRRRLVRTPTSTYRVGEVDACVRLPPPPRRVPKEEQCKSSKWQELVASAASERAPLRPRCYSGTKSHTNARKFGNKPSPITPRLSPSSTPVMRP